MAAWLTRLALVAERSSSSSSSLESSSSSTTDDDFIFRVSITDATQPLSLPLDPSGSYNFQVDWGEGAGFDTQITGYGQPNSIHTFGATGVYEVSIRGTCSVLKAANSASFREGLLTVINWGQIGLTTCKAMFKGVSNSEFGNSVAGNTLVAPITGIETVTDFSEMFSEVSGLDQVPTGLFDNAEAGTNFQHCFKDSAELELLPGRLFKFTAATNLRETFKDCVYLDNLPADLLDGLGSVDCEGLFEGCSAIETVPTQIVYELRFAPNLKRLFKGCGAILLLPSGLFNRVSATSVSQIFQNCVGLVEIPSDLFATPTALQDLSYCFDGCTSLDAIPAGLLDSVGATATSMEGVFQRCTSVAAIPPGLLASCTKVTNLKNAFNGCAITSVPAGLFDNNTEVTTFERCFYNCKDSAFTSVPASLFAFCTKVVSFRECFASCTALTSVPEGLFDNNPLVTDISGCFSNTPLATLPAGLLDALSLLTDASRAFAACDFTSIPSDIITAAKHPNLTSLQFCFGGCNLVTSAVPTLWTQFPWFSASQSDRCFYDCTLASNYSSIPDDWKS